MSRAAAGPAARDASRRVALTWSPAVLVVAAGAGFFIARVTEPMVHNRYFPWIVGRGLGLSAYVSLTAMCLLGLWLRHPWRLRWRVLHPETALRVHAALAASTIVLVAGHLTSLALDKYAGVGWIGTVVPGAATYRPLAVGIGVVSLWVMVAIAATARLGARFIGWRWLPVHQLSLPLFGSVFCHAVLAGSDTETLRAAYVATGALVVVTALTRRLARPVTAPIRSVTEDEVAADRMPARAALPGPRPALPAALPALPAARVHAGGGHLRWAPEASEASSE